MTAQPSRKKKRRDELAGRVVGGRYQLILRLASGGMGSVYAGRAVGAGGFERRLAIKLLHEHLAEREKFVAMFLDEARLAAKIHHPNVVSTIDVFEWDERYYLVMEYVEGLELGRLLHSALKRKVKLPIRVVLRIMLDALAGLVAAHELTDKNGQPLNLVHRDISPQNIMVGADGISRLTDFGVAKAEDQIHVTVGAEFKGKVAYAAPEQLEHSVVEQRSDVFAMGIILWETLTQKRLFKAEDKHGIKRMVLAGGYPVPSEIDPTLLPFDRLVEEAMAPEIGKRTSSALELMRQVEEVASTVGGPAGASDVRKWVRDLAQDFLAERQEELRVAEAAVPYPSDAGAMPHAVSPSGEFRGIAGPTGPEQSEVVPSGSARDYDPGPTMASRPAGLTPANAGPTPAPTPAPSGAPNVAIPPLDPAAAGPTLRDDPEEVRRRADAASFDGAATRKYERPESGAEPDPADPYGYLRTDPSGISVELLESEPGRPHSGVEPTGGHSRDLGQEDPFGAAGEAGTSTSVIEKIAARHSHALWVGAGVMVALAILLVGYVALTAMEDPAPPAVRVLEVGERSVTETGSETETGSVTETGSESESETETESATESVTASETGSESESETETESETATEPEAGTRARPVGMRRSMVRSMATMTTSPADPAPVQTAPTMDEAEPDMGLADNPYRDL